MASGGSPREAASGGASRGAPDDVPSGGVGALDDVPPAGARPGASRGTPGKSALVLAEDGSGSWSHATLTRETDTGLHVVLKNRKGGPGRNGVSRLVPWLAVERGEVKLPLAFLPVATSDGDIGYDGTNPERLGERGALVWGKEVRWCMERQTWRVRIRYAPSLKKARQKRQVWIDIPGVSQFKADKAYTKADACIKAWIEDPIRWRRGRSRSPGPRTPLRTITKKIAKIANSQQRPLISLDLSPPLASANSYALTHTHTTLTVVWHAHA